MEIGIDSFAALNLSRAGKGESTPREAMAALLEKIELADRAGLDVFGVGEHFRQEYLDSAPSVILGAAAAKTERIRLTSAVSVLSAVDPVRLFQQFATLDLISGGRVEMVVGRGSFTESFPLFGLSFEDYDALFVEKLELLLKIRESERVTWSGRFRPELRNQAIYPRPVQNPIPVWIGVGGTPASFARAGALGLPLMVAVIGGETHRFRPLIDLYRKAGEKAGVPPEKLKVGLHSPGYVAADSAQAAEDFFPGYAETFTRIGKERGWGGVNRAQFDAMISRTGAFLVGNPEEVAEKLIRHSEALGGISRFTFQMDIGLLPREKYLNSIELIGSKLIPLIRKKLLP